MSEKKENQEINQSNEGWTNPEADSTKLQSASQSATDSATEKKEDTSSPASEGKESSFDKSGLEHYAIVEAGGGQLKIREGQLVVINRIKGDVGAQVALDKVLMLREKGAEGRITFGTPVVPGVSVTAQIVRHLRGEKIKVFKKKRRQGYKKMRGHRQDLTELRIGEIPTL